MKKRVLRFFKNQYTIATTIFVLWICFFSEIDLFYILRTRVELGSLKKEVRELERKNEQAKVALQDLNNNTTSLEKFAREAYYMKRDNEDVFVFKAKTE
ncbi:MAG: FtsB family cell division protein [Flavobacteriales bacterium]